DHGETSGEQNNAPKWKRGHRSRSTPHHRSPFFSPHETPPSIGSKRGALLSGFRARRCIELVTFHRFTTDSVPPSVFRVFLSLPGSLPGGRGRSGRGRRNRRFPG